MTIYDFGTIVLVNFPQTDLKKARKDPLSLSMTREMKMSF